MTISRFQGFGPLNFASRLTFRLPPAAPFDGGGVRPSQRNALQLKNLGGKVAALKGAVGELRLSARVRAGGGQTFATAATAMSQDDLGLSLEESAATLSSTDEVNATPTSFSPFAPSFSGLSTSSPTVGGVYDGSLGNQELTFEVRQTRIVGLQRILIDVFDEQDDLVETVTFQSSDPAGTVKTLGIGLTLSLSGGTVIRDDTFQVDVYADVGSTVDPNKPFDGTGNDNPNFEFGYSVGAGSFLVNGTQIDVLANDTLLTVLDKITNSQAGVLATFDSANERVRLTQKTEGAAHSIVVGSDTSGFLDATKLSGAFVKPGVDSDLDRPIGEVAELAGIASGTFSINGTQFNVDILADSLQSLIDDINASEAKVTASFDEVANKLVITSDTEGATVVLSDGNSRFFGTLGILEGEYEAELDRNVQRGRRFAKEDALSTALSEVQRALTNLFSETFVGAASVHADRALATLRSAIEESFAELSVDVDGDFWRSGLGVDFTFDDPTQGVLDLDREHLADSLGRKSEELVSFLVGDDGDGGLLAALEGAADKIGQDLLFVLDPATSGGLIVDLSA